MFNEFRNYLIKTAALMGAAASLVYFVPRVSEKFEEPKIEKSSSKEIALTDSDDLSKYDRRARRPASVSLDLNEEESAILIEEDSNKEIEEDFRADEDPALKALANANFNNASEDETSTPSSTQDAVINYGDTSPSGGDSEANGPRVSKREPSQESQSSSSNDSSEQSDFKSVADLDSADSSDDNLYGISNCTTNCNSSDVSDNSSSADSSGSQIGGSTDSSSTSEVAPVVTADIGSGNFSTNPNVTLSSAQSGDIYYCVANGSCCDPNPSAGGILYSSTLNIGSGDGNYCLSYVGISPSGILGESANQTYLVDQTLPDMDSIVDIQYLQTTQQSSIAIDSDNFGESGYDYGLYGLSSDPSALNCKQVEENFLHGTYGVDFDGNSTPDLFDLSSIFATITTPLRPDIMQYGSAGNFFVSILSNRNPTDEAKRTCVTHRVILQDFDYFAFAPTTTSAPAVNGSGHMEVSGSFNSFGIFREPAAIGDNTITSGSSKYELDSSNILESSKEEIIY
ncbi:hypothetical protein [Halobacteriovorax marinus]|uniref:hypothetical protein n=1 Tax=Halobacteriovorax marinus TaxID=97084 RepID=UPI003A9211B8